MSARVRVLCLCVVAIELHERRRMNLDAVPWMSLGGVVTASLRCRRLGEVVAAPGVEDAGPLDATSATALDVFAGQCPQLARHYCAS